MTQEKNGYAEFITEPERRTPVMATVDVLIAGGGTAGVTAALAAAAQGAKTMIIEQFGSLGGSTTNALVTPLMLTGIVGDPAPSSFSAAIDRRVEALGDRFSGRVYDPETMKFACQQLLEEADVDILYYTHICEPIMEGSAVRGLLIENKSGRGAILAKCVIDCTGDADVCARAGVGYDSGAPEDGRNQAVSLRYILSGVDFDKVVDFFNSLQPGCAQMDNPCFHAAFVRESGDWPIRPYFEKAMADGVLQPGDDIYWQMFSIPGKPGFAALNCPGMYTHNNGASADDLTRAQLTGRRIIARHLQFYKKYLRGFENASLSQAAPMVGVRESRRIHGIDTVTAEDVFAYRKRPDGVAKCNYPIDVHRVGKPPIPTFYDQTVPPEERYFEIPYGCLVPRGADNLLVAGRCVSCDFLAQSSLRIIPIVRALGDAAGTAAAMAAKCGISPKDIDGKMIRADMKQRGASL